MAKIILEYSVQCTMNSVQCTAYNVQSTLQIVDCTFCIVQCTVYSVHCTLFNVQCTVYSVHYTLYTIHCTLHTELYHVNQSRGMFDSCDSGGRPLTEVKENPGIDRERDQLCHQSWILGQGMWQL